MTDVAEVRVHYLKGRDKAYNFWPQNQAEARVGAAIPDRVAAKVPVLLQVQFP